MVIGFGSALLVQRLGFSPDAASAVLDRVAHWTLVTLGGFPAEAVDAMPDEAKLLAATTALVTALLAALGKAARSAGAEMGGLKGRLIAFLGKFL
jgi:hypothetical protein